MTDIEKIKAEIERLKEINEKRFKNIVDPAQQENIDEEQLSHIIQKNKLDKEFLLGRLMLLGDLLSFIETLEPEPTLPSDVDEAAFDYAESCKYDGADKLLCAEHFKAGAEWMKEQLRKEDRV